MSNNSSVYKLRVIGATVIDPSGRQPSRAPKLYVRAHLAESDTKKKTKVSRRSYLPEWNEEILL
ncbi:hypothetical protein B0H21DRAFT_890716 [Amylocystis lapponica]|nr:hypothetical protein B0H21DRAFT_890716 [Amylocystis lapponica]